MAEDAWSAADYARNARFVSDLGAPLIDMLAPRPGERILDLGCGDGELTERIAAAGAEVVGVDASLDMVAAARARGLDAREGDAAELGVEGPFDAVFSNAAMHWMTDPDAVIAGLADRLAPGGRVVAEFGGHGNVAAIRTALIAVLARQGIDTDLSDIWYFPTAEEHRARLEAGGFVVDEIALIPRPTRLERGIKAWLRTLAAPVLSTLPGEAREEVANEVAALLKPALRDSNKTWWADYVRLRFSARRA